MGNEVSDDDDKKEPVQEPAQRRRSTVLVSKQASAMLNLDGDQKARQAAIAYAAVSTVVAGCVSCVPFELLNKADRGCSELILFAQLFYAATELLVTCGASGVKDFIFSRQMPLYCHVSTLL